MKVDTRKFVRYIYIGSLDTRQFGRYLYKGRLKIRDSMVDIDSLVDI